MKTNTIRRPRLLLFAVLGSLLGNTAMAQSTCYNSRGEEDPNLRPCSAAGEGMEEATWCCARGDTCLSNGLCLSPGSSNLMTQQGCTDKNWGGSCKKYCSASNGKLFFVSDSRRETGPIRLTPSPFFLHPRPDTDPDPPYTLPGELQQRHKQHQVLLRPRPFILLRNVHVLDIPPCRHRCPMAG